MTDLDQLTSGLLTDLYIGGKAVDVAEQAAASFAATPPRARAEILRAAFQLMTAQREDLAPLIGREGGHEGVLDYTEPRYVALGW